MVSSRRHPMNESPASPRQTLQPRQQMRPLLQVLSLPLLAFLILPLAALILRAAPRSLVSNLSEPQVLQAIGLSLSTSLAATLVTVLLGTPLAYSMARRYLPFQRAIDTLIDIPTVLPPAVAGVAMLMAFGRRGIFGSLLESLGLNIAFTTLAVVLAQTFIAAPFYVKAAIIGFAGIDRELEQAAALDGANGWQAFRYIILPLSWTALTSGSVLTWARAMGEFG
ncbi:MAG: ABC transporter permease subunit, partial [Chloroflexota bacterium]